MVACGTTTASGGTAADVQEAADVATDTSDVATTDGPFTTVADVQNGADGADVAGGDSPALAMCKEIATKYCAAAKTCCPAGASTACAADQEAACLKAGFAGLEDASTAGLVKTDATRLAACQKALDAATKACDRVAMEAARRQCLLAWTDVAKVGDQCAATAPVPCDGVAGRCGPLTVDLYECRKAGGQGDSCSPGVPCSLELECQNTTLTRAMQCDKPGSTCHLSDSCPQGFECSTAGEVCVPWDGGAKDGQPCKADADCAVGLACTSSKCAPSFCGL